MTSDRAHEALYESEAALRLVDQELSRLGGESIVRTSTLADLPAILLRANAQLVDVLTRLRAARTALQSSATERFQATHEKIRQVTSATEDAATNIMDACDRASQIVDALDQIDEQPVPDRPAALALRGTLRDEIFHMMSALQFQDITTQQLTHASAVLTDMEARLADVVKLFDAGLDESNDGVSTCALDELTYDPNATTTNAVGRQALADEIFTGIRLPAA